jgi:hypothetical protein
MDDQIATPLHAEALSAVLARWIAPEPPGEAPREPEPTPVQAAV